VLTLWCIDHCLTEKGESGSEREYVWSLWWFIFWMMSHFILFGLTRLKLTTSSIIRSWCAHHSQTQTLFLVLDLYFRKEGRLLFHNNVKLWSKERQKKNWCCPDWVRFAVEHCRFGSSWSSLVVWQNEYFYLIWCHREKVLWSDSRWMKTAACIETSMPR
jgi:hypothetical protein